MPRTATTNASRARGLVGHCLAFLRGDEGLAYIRSENRHGVDGPVPVTAPPRRNLRPRARGRGLFSQSVGLIIRHHPDAPKRGGKIIPALSREEANDGPGNSAQDVLAVRKQERDLTNCNLIRADRYPKWNNHLLLS